VFEVHQPFRIKRDFFWENQNFKRIKKKEFFSYYFDHPENKKIFDRTCRKCYFPSNRILLDAIDEHKRDRKKVKVSFSISGVFLEQCEMFNKDLLETFKQLSETGNVEFLNQTYYHSLASLYQERDEFIEQVRLHKQAVKGLLNFTPNVFENTELLYNNIIAKTIENLGYNGIFTEGVERVLHGKSPNQIYLPKGCKKIRLLLRNYKLTDDIGFRFSAKWWSGWPLTANKFSSWLAATSGQCINIFPDYETFGEHHWPETGIHEFLKHLPNEILKWRHLNMATPSEVIDKYNPVGQVDVPELGQTVSWADLERDSRSWIGNTMQWAYYTAVKRLKNFLKEAEDEELYRIWRYFQTSDHLYYMFTSGGGPGEVHSYFSPFSTPQDAYVTAQSALFDLENRVRMISIAANEPFLFYTGTGKKHYTGNMAWTLKGFLKAIQDVTSKSLEFHNLRKDFEKWSKSSLLDDELTLRFRNVRLSKAKGKNLRKSIVKIVKDRIKKQQEKNNL
jgi:alpha-amylase